MNETPQMSPQDTTAEGATLREAFMRVCATVVASAHLATGSFAIVLQYRNVVPALPQWTTALSQYMSARTTLALLPFVLASLQKQAAAQATPPPPPSGVTEPTGVGNYATQGQAEGARMLQGAAAASSRAISGATPGAGQTSDSSQLFLREWIPGATGDVSRYQSVLADPKTMKDAAMQARRNALANGCTTTTFAPVETNRIVLAVNMFRVTLIPILDANAQPTGRFNEQLSTAPDVVYNVPLEWGAIGFSRTRKIDVSLATATQPGVRAVLTGTPFYAPLDGSHFIYNVRITQGSGTITTHGALKSGYIPTGTLSTVGGQAAITADLYRADRDYYQPTSTGCQPDPQFCVLNGVSFCAAPNTGIYPDLWLARPNHNEAFVTIQDSAARPKPSVSDSNIQQIMARSRNVIDGTDPIWSETFSGCTVTPTSSPGQTITKRIPDIRTCNDVRIAPDATTCSGTRRLAFSPLAMAQHAIRVRYFQNVQVPIPNTVPQQYSTRVDPYVYTGSVNVNFALIGAASYYTRTPDANGVFAQYEVNRLAADPSTSIPYNIGFATVGAGTVSGSIITNGEATDNWLLNATVDAVGITEMNVLVDYYQVTLNDIAGCKAYFDAVGDGFCTAPQMSCTDSRGSCTTVGAVSFCTTGGPAQGIARLLAKWGPTDSARQNPNDPTQMIAGAGAIELAPTMCFAATAGPLDCSRLRQGVGGCYVDAQGVTQCISVDGTQFASHFGDPTYVDDCAARQDASGRPLWNNAACELVDRQTCMPGQQGLFSGTCYTRTVTYDCGETTTVTLPGGSALTQSCGGPIRCMGTQCHNVTTETNTDFAQVSAKLTALDLSQQDIGCLETDGSPPTSATASCTLRLFSGKTRMCKIAIGSPGSTIGIGVDCCQQGEEAAAGIDVGKYLQLIILMSRAAKDPIIAALLAKIPGVPSVIDAFSTAGSTVTSGIEAVTEPIATAFSSLASQFGFGAASVAEVSAAEAAMSLQLQISGGVATAAAEATCVVGGVYTEVIAKILTDLFGKEAGTAFLGAMASSAPLGQALQMLNTIFMIYSIIKILVAIIFKCTKEELQLGIDRKIGNCAVVGEYKEGVLGLVKQRVYCCYKSPLSRIIAEQLRNPPTARPPGQSIGGGWGDVKAPKCAGFSEEEIASADFNRIDLTEWLIRLQQSGMLPSSDAQAEVKYGPGAKRVPERITKGAPGPYGDTSPKQAVERLMTAAGSGGAFTDGAKAIEKQPVCYNNAALMPWYQKAVKPEDIIVPIGGTGSSASCGNGCIQLTLGEITDNNLAGNNCAIPYRQFFDMNVYRPDLITRAELVEGYWDDKMQIDINGQVVFESQNWNLARCDYGITWCFGTLSTPNFCDYFSHGRPTSDGMSTWTYQNQPIDVTSYIKQEGNIRISTNAKAGGRGEAYARMRIYYTNGAVPNPASSADCITPP